MKHLIAPVYHQRIQHLRLTLSPLNLSNFRESCFGSFLDLQEIEIHGGLMSLIVRSMLSECTGVRRLSFLVKDTHLQLGALEFYCLTGLKFKKGPCPPQSSNMHDDIFQGKMDLNFTDIKQAFEEQCKQTAGTGSTCLKLSLLYVLYGVILFQGNTRTSIDIGHVHMVDEIDKFNSYHWGVVAYDNFVSFTQSLSNKIRRSKNASVFPSIKEQGLCFLLQIWAFEVMPSLSLSPWAVQRRLLSRISPRMLRWAVIPYSDSDEFKIEFSDSDCLKMTPIQPSDEECEAWDAWGINFTGEECARLYSMQPLPKQNKAPINSVENHKFACRGGSLSLPAWDQIVENWPDQSRNNDGTKYLIKEIYGKVDEAIIRLWRKDNGLSDLSSRLDVLLHDRIAENTGPSTPGIDRSEKRRRR